MRCRCCRTWCRGTASGRWPGSGCSARAPSRYSSPGARYPLAGLLLALPALAGTGLLETARSVYGRLRNGFYGLEMLLVACVFLALLREPRAEGATRVPPAALGRVLGLDRAPEVKTIRRKLAELAAAGKAADWQLATARHHAATRPDTLGFCYIDGHTRAYFGTRDVQKMHVARLKFPGPATEETWVTDGAGVPLLVVIAEPSTSLAAQIKDLLPALRGICGDDAKPVLCFDRGGWSPDLFASITAAGFDLLTYRKADAGKDIPALPDDAFATASWTGDDARACDYDLAESTVALPVTAGEHKGDVLTLRQVTRRDNGRQVHILTTRDAAALPAGGRGLPDDQPVAGGELLPLRPRPLRPRRARLLRRHLRRSARLVPNPAKKTAAAAVSTAKRPSPKPKPPAMPNSTRCAARPRHHRRDHQRDAREAGAPADAARRTLEAAQAAAKATPAKIPLASTTPAWCGWTPRPSSSPTPSGWPPATPRPPSPVP